MADEHITRRRFVAGTIATDVVIVGAGLAGLTGARRIVAAGRSVVVLKAQP